MKKSELENALHDQFGDRVYCALNDAGMSLPEMCKMAALDWFVKPPVSRAGKARAGMVRHALSNLHELGEFRFDKESKS